MQSQINHPRKMKNFIHQPCQHLNLTLETSKAFAKDNIEYTIVSVGLFIFHDHYCMSVTKM